MGHGLAVFGEAGVEVEGVVAPGGSFSTTLLACSSISVISKSALHNIPVPVMSSLVRSWTVLVSPLLHRKLNTLGLFRISVSNSFTSIVATKFLGFFTLITSVEGVAKKAFFFRIRLFMVPSSRTLLLW